ncbi:MAG: TIR domain-containing protein, partial [bacterium]|nr:TIR domain-containing protein [bacterium]
MDTVFISYSHDSKEHSERVLAFADRLRKDGLDCILDQYEMNPPEGWPKWMDRQLKQAKQVIIICTRTYCDRVMGEETPGKGKGVKWESSLVYQYLYREDSKNNRFIPVVFEEDDCRYIPVILEGVTFYCANDEEGYDKLYRRLTNQPDVIKPGLGEIKKRPPREIAGDFVKPSQDSISTYKLPTTGERLFGRDPELRILEKAWGDKYTHIVTLVAWGGVGKTALVNRWLNQMAQKDYGGAQKVYGWSFYSQGAAEGKQASADEFFQEALQWFGDADPTAGSAVEKGRRLARLVRRQKTLLLLDGLEPLQYPPGEIHGFDGKLKDPGIAAFLKQLAGGHEGLCVISTRLGVTDLEDKKGFGLNEVRLDRLSEAAGLELLTSLGVTTGSERDFKEAVTEYGGHALALTLLGRYIKGAYDGDIRKRDEIRKLTEGKIKEGGHAEKVMAAYEKWLGDCAEKDVLYMMGLFDRPVEKGAIEALKEKPAIPGVTDQLQALSAEDWQWALTHLREAGLLAEENPMKPGTLDCHPLVREFFGDRLLQQNPKGRQAAHQRLYNYFKNLPKKELPDTLQDMEPLFAAVAHGCKAGLHQEVMDDVYWKRISREQEGYTVHKVGAFGADLAAVSHFFDVPWSRPAAGLIDLFKMGVLSWVAFSLQALGRLREAVQPMKASIDNAIQQKSWENAASGTGRFSELLLTLGDVPQAMAYARESVIHSDRSGDEFQMVLNRCTLADVLHQSGAVTEAEKWFREAEEKQKKRQLENPFLYSFWGYQFWDLLLENSAQGTTKDVIERAEKAIEIAKENRWLLDVALGKLTLGRAWMKQALTGAKEKSENFSRAMDFLRQAVEGLREAGAQEFLLRGLLARAECYRHINSYPKAWEDLNEAKEIALLGNMKLFLCDYHLEAGKLCKEEGKNKDAEEHFEKARELIQETGYKRRELKIK